MTEGITILRRDGTVLFRSQTATTVEEAVRELVAEARADLSNVDLRFADLSHVRLSNVDLRFADLSNVDLRFADLRHVRLSNVDLRFADLRFADLRHVRLSNVDLRFADLSHVRLSNVDLRFADLRFADLRHARNVPLVLTVGPVDGWTLSLINTTEGWRFDAGCRHFTEVQARSHWSNSLAWSKGAAPEHGARMLAGVDALIALATAMGWPEKLVVESNQEETT